MAIPNPYVYWTGSHSSNFEFYIEGTLPVTGAVDIENKPATGSMVNPAIRFVPTPNFYTSGTTNNAGAGIRERSFVGWKVTGSLPEQYRIYFTKTEHNLPLGAGNAAQMQFGFLFGATNLDRPDQVNNLCGMGILFHSFNSLNPPHDLIVVEEGKIVKTLNSVGGSGFGFTTGAIQTFTIDVQLNRTLGALSGAMAYSLNMIAAGRGRSNEGYKYLTHTSRKENVDTELTGNGTVWQNKRCDSLYVICVNSFSGAVLTNSFIEIDNFAILAHPAGPGKIYRPAPLTSAVVTFDLLDPANLPGMTWWGIADSQYFTQSTYVTHWMKASGSAPNFGGSQGATTSSITLSNGTYETLLFSGTRNHMTGGNNGLYISASTHYVGLVGQIDRATLLSTPSYNNHILIQEILYYKSGTDGRYYLDYFNYSNGVYTASVPVYPGVPFFLECYRDASGMSMRVVDQYGTRTAYRTANQITNLTSYNALLGSTTQNVNSRHHIRELVYSQLNVSGSNISNYIRNKYGFPLLSASVDLGGVRW